MGYLGNQSTFTGSQNNKRISVLATAGQTLFTVAGGYAINQIDVYRNGVKLSASRDFNALDGSTVTLVEGASGGDIIEFVIFENFDVADALVTSGDNVANGNFTINGELAVTGGIVGDIYAPTSGIATEAVRAGIATSAESLNAGATGSDLNLSGIVTAVQFSGNITGTAATFTGNVTVGGTLTYDDVTNIDSIGLITARNGLQVLAGITTLNGQVSAGNLNVTGVVTAASFSGDGSSLSGVGTQGSVLVADTASVTGVSTFANVIVGQATTQFVVNGDARITGVMTVGTDSVTINPTGNVVNIGAGITIEGGGGLAVSGIMTANGITVGQNAIGARTVQSGGVASGGSDGDIYYIY